MTRPTDAQLYDYVNRAQLALGFPRSDAVDEIFRWCMANPPERPPCVHSWFARQAGRFRCVHCGMTIELA